MRATLAAVVGATLLLLGGCGKSELYGGLNEKEANEMLAVIDGAGIDASKASEDGLTWTLHTRGNQFSQAIRVLHDAGYPHDDFESLGEVFKKEGFVSSPLEERARLIYGLSQELSATISQIDGVTAARVHLAVPETDPLAEVQRPSSASIFIKHSPDVDLGGQIGSIKALVVNSIEGLPYDKVTVVMFAARPLTARVPADTIVAQANAPVLAGFVALTGAGALAVFAAMHLRHRRFWPWKVKA